MLENVNGLTIHYEIQYKNDAKGTPVLYLHGWGCDGGIFAPMTDALGKYATQIVLDFPAHGQSEEPAEPWGVVDFARQVQQVLRSQRIEKVKIVAHSFGARVAIWLAAHDPQLVEQMVITGGAGIKAPATQQSSKRTKRYKRLSAVARTMMKIPPLNRPMKKLQEALVQRYGSADYARLNESMRKTFVKIVSEDLTPLLSQVSTPTLLIWGDRDTETPLWMGQTMEHDMKDGGLVVFEGRTHYAFLEESARFVLIVKQFFWGGDEG